MRVRSPSRRQDLQHPPMPRDDDEDVSAPLGLGPERPSSRTFSPGARAPRPNAALPPGTKPTPGGGFAWGVCGVLHTPGELTTFPGRVGVVRYVSSGVGYTAPPIGHTWRPVPSE